MEIIDISWPISPSMTNYKDKNIVRFKALKTFEKDKARVSEICLDTHTGTHVEASSHFLNGQTIDQISLSSLIGQCKVIDLMHIKDSIKMEDLESFAISSGDIILFKTKNSSFSVQESFNYRFVFLEQKAAQYLADIDVKAVGIDYLGLERDQDGHPSHEALMRKNIPIIEGLRFAHVFPGNYFFCCLPLSLPNLEAAPARAVLIKNL